MDKSSFKLSRVFLTNKIIVALLLATSLVTFILLFQPYDYNRLSFGTMVEVLSLVFVCTFMFSVAFQMTLKTRFGRAIWYNVFIWLFYTGIISQIIYFYTILKGYNGFALTGVLIYFATSLILSLIPFLIYILLFNRYNTLRDGQTVLKINDQEFPIHKILMFKAEDNYVKITYLDENNKTVSTLVRNTMKKVLRSAGNRVFLRIHRSYAINLDHFSHYTGNQKGYFAHLNHLDQVLPVSRYNGKIFLQRIRTIRH